MSPDVGVQVALFRAPEVTMGTHMWFFSRVRVNVFLQRHLLRRAKLAVTACIRPFAGVDTNVGLEVAEAPADFAAVRADEVRRAVRTPSGFLKCCQIVRKVVPDLGLHGKPAIARHHWRIQRVAGW